MTGLDDYRPSRILVGIDGSRASMMAVDWAARAAAGTDRALRLCIVLPREHVAGFPGAPALVAELQHRGEHLLGRAQARALEVAPGLRTTLHIATGHSAEELRRMAAPTDVIVVGSHGAGWFNRFIIGSTSTQVAAHARCTVVVTRVEAPPEHGPVVVGVDESEPAQAALQFGFETADREGRVLHAIHTFSQLPLRAAGNLAVEREMTPPNVVAAAAVLDHALAPWLEKYPEVVIRREVAPGPAGRVLLEAAMNAALLVVGSRGRGGFSGLLLGSVSQHVLALSRCPVAITR